MVENEGERKGEKKGGETREMEVNKSTQLHIENYKLTKKKK